MSTVLAVVSPSANTVTISPYSMGTVLAVVSDKDLKFLVQSDESEFLNYMKAELKNVVVLEDEIRHISATKEIIVDLLTTATLESNYEYAQLF